MRRFFRRKLTAIVLAVCLVLFLRRQYPQLGRQIGNFISGLCNERVRQAFSRLLGALPEDGVEAIEVFYEQVAAG